MQGLAPAGDLLSCSRKNVGKEALPASPALWRRARHSLARSCGTTPINWPCETPRSPLAAEGPPGRSLN